MGGINVLQIDPGAFIAYQANLEVGQVVVIAGQQGAATEHWFLYAAGQGQPPPGKGVYVKPGQQQYVTTSYYCVGGPPQSFDPQAFKQQLQQQLGQALIVQYIRADCSPPSLEEEGGDRKKKKKKKDD